MYYIVKSQDTILCLENLNMYYLAPISHILFGQRWSVAPLIYHWFYRPPTKKKKKKKHLLFLGFHKHECQLLEIEVFCDKTICVFVCLKTQSSKPHLRSSKGYWILTPPLAAKHWECTTFLRRININWGPFVIKLRHDMKKETNC